MPRRLTSTIAFRSIAHSSAFRIVEFYLEARQQSAVNLLDGAGQRPHYSIRTLVRALDYTRTNVAVYGFERALYEGATLLLDALRVQFVRAGFTMSFATSLVKESRDAVES